MSTPTVSGPNQTSNHSGARTASARPTRLARPPVWRGFAPLVVLLAAVLATVGCGQQPATARAATTTTASAATAIPASARATAVAGPQLAWRSVSHPLQDISPAVPVFAPSDGAVAYLCIEADSGTVAHTYFTRDAGATWTPGGDLPVGARPSERYSLECYITVDANNPGTAVIDAGWVERGADGMISQYANYASFDFGAHWRKLVYPHPFIFGSQLASYHGSFYAFGTTQIPEGAGPQVWVSHDQFGSWAPIAVPNSIVPGYLWLNPVSGALLLETSDSVLGSPPVLLQSADGGAHWQALPAPAGQGGWVVQTPTSAAPWQICGSSPVPPGNTSADNTLVCSADGGQTWKSEPVLTFAAITPKGFAYTDVAVVFAIAGDGALLAYASYTTMHVYRLPAGASVWQDLGRVPSVASVVQSPAYYPTAAGGNLWYAYDTFRADYPQ